MDRFSVRTKKTTDVKNALFAELAGANDVIEIVPNRLYFAVYRNSQKIFRDTENVHFFNTDDTLTYANFYNDFGPLNLGKLYSFCQILYAKLRATKFERKKIVYWTASKPEKRTNAAFLIGAFGVILLDMSPHDALTLLYSTGYDYPPFVDAYMGGTYNIAHTIRLHDCFSGINKAFYFNLVNFADFDLTEYESYEGVNPNSMGDLSWIVPNKLLAFAGPCGEKNGNWPVETYLTYFRDRGVRTVVRLNKSRYDSRRFTSQGVDHFDLIFPDGTTPPDDILTDFLEIVENVSGSTAVHCKAGLGRTGCLIGVYLMKHYRMTSGEAIAWMRICRPGCVIGHQQTWLEEKQRWAWKQGDIYREKHFRSSERVRQHKFGIYSIKSKLVSVEPTSDFDKTELFGQIRERIKRRMSTPDYTDELLKKTQGDILVAAKRKHLSKQRKRS